MIHAIRAVLSDVIIKKLENSRSFLENLERVFMVKTKAYQEIAGGRSPLADKCNYQRFT